MPDKPKLKPDKPKLKLPLQEFRDRGWTDKHKAAWMVRKQMGWMTQEEVEDFVKKQLAEKDAQLDAVWALPEKWEKPCVNMHEDSSTDISYDASRLACARELRLALATLNVQAAGFAGEVVSLRRQLIEKDAQLIQLQQDYGVTLTHVALIEAAHQRELDAVRARLAQWRSQSETFEGSYLKIHVEELESDLATAQGKPKEKQ